MTKKGCKWRLNYIHLSTIFWSEFFFTIIYWNAGNKIHWNFIQTYYFEYEIFKILTSENSNPFVKLIGNQMKKIHSRYFDEDSASYLRKIMKQKLCASVSSGIPHLQTQLQDCFRLTFSWPSLIFAFNLLLSPVNPNRFSFCFFHGFLAISILLSPENKTLFKNQLFIQIIFTSGGSERNSY